MSDHPIELRAERIQFLSDLDEESFFRCLDRMVSFLSYEGEGDAVKIVVKSDKLSDGDLRNLLGLFSRYGVDMRQLVVFVGTDNEVWMRNPEAYWFRTMFR